MSKPVQNEQARAWLDDAGLTVDGIAALTGKTAQSVCRWWANGTFDPPVYAQTIVKAFKALPASEKSRLLPR